jgi:hypothetical protein
MTAAGATCSFRAVEPNDNSPYISAIDGSPLIERASVPPAGQPVGTRLRNLIDGPGEGPL